MNPYLTLLKSEKASIEALTKLTKAPSVSFVSGPSRRTQKKRMVSAGVGTMAASCSPGGLRWIGAGLLRRRKRPETPLR